jgi:glycosyltransferase involved in cell wall biosynthesis
MKEVRTIALVEWNWMGHHPTQFAYFVLALEESGINVLAFCPNPDEARRNIDGLRCQHGSGKSNCGQTVYREVTVPSRRFRHIRPGRISSIDWTIRHFRSIERMAKEAAKESGKQLDLIFYACIYDWDFEWIHAAKPFLNLPWSGHYLHARSFRMAGRPNPVTGNLPCPEKMFGGTLCKGITILDEGIVEQVTNSIGKTVVALPDLTDERTALNVEDQILGGKLKEFAAGRPIVGLFGYLQKSKGILTFLEAARTSTASDICFALGGEVLWPSDRSETNQIQRALAECPNVWNHLARIPGETRLNHLMSVCDVLFAAYLDFPHSSGIQSKAAALKKPLIVSDGFLMAERGRRFNMGEVIPQGNAPALVEAILRMTNDPTAWMANNKPLWKDYCREHSFERLKTSLKELLASV